MVSHGAIYDGREKEVRLRGMAGGVDAHFQIKLEARCRVELSLSLFPVPAPLLACAVWPLLKVTIVRCSRFCLGGFRGRPFLFQSEDD